MLKREDPITYNRTLYGKKTVSRQLVVTVLPRTKLALKEILSIFEDREVILEDDKCKIADILESINKTILEAYNELDHSEPGDSNHCLLHDIECLSDAIWGEIGRRLYLQKAAESSIIDRAPNPRRNLGIYPENATDAIRSWFRLIEFHALYGSEIMYEALYDRKSLAEPI